MKLTPRLASVEVYERDAEQLVEQILQTRPCENVVPGFSNKVQIILQLLGYYFTLVQRVEMQDPHEIASILHGDFMDER